MPHRVLWPLAVAREQARMYVKGIRDGQSEFDLSPEENEAIQTALGR